MRDLPPQSLLHELLDYDAATGVFVWKTGTQKFKSLAGQVAGSTSPLGYRLIGVRGYGQLLAHRLAWIYVYGGTLGDQELDHIDCDPLNNAIANLRFATSSQQKQNRGVQTNNQCGLKGAYFHACRKGMQWRTQIKVGKRLIFIGYFPTAEEAHRAYVAAAHKYFGAFARAA